MRRTSFRLFAALALAFAASAAFAHAQLDKSTPPVGGVVASASQIRLKFTESVEPKFSGVTLTGQGGASIPLGPASVDPTDHATLIVDIGKPLPPGVYIVKWRAVSTDTHHTQGAFDFTVKP